MGRLLRIGCLGLVAILVLLLIVGTLARAPDEATPARAPDEATLPREPGEPANQQASRAAIIADHLHSNFGIPGYETSWYRFIRKIEVLGSQVTIRTTIYPDAEGRRYATSICAAVSGLIFAKDRKDLGLDTIVVTGQGDQVLVRRSGVGGRC